MDIIKKLIALAAILIITTIPALAERIELGVLTISNNFTVTGTSTLNGVVGSGDIILTNAAKVEVPNAVNNQEAMTLGQGLELMGSRSTMYLCPTVAVYGVAGQTNRYLTTTGSPTSWSVVVTTNAVAGSYICNFIDIGRAVTTVRQGVQTARIRIIRNGGGGAALTVKLEGYTFNTNTLVKTEYAETGEAVTIGTTATPLDFYATVPYLTNLAPDEVYMVSLKAVTANNITSVTVSGGSNTLSYVELPTAAPVDIGLRGAVSIKTASNSATGTYNSVGRVLTLPDSYSYGTNNIGQYGGTLNGTNGIYWLYNGTNYWLLLK